jgi:hypothetical protein
LRNEKSEVTDVSSPAVYKFKQMLRGMKTYVPGSVKTTQTGGTNSARYCYGVWLRHLILARANGMATFPGDLAELGPGDSIGIGLAGLMSGAQTYRALDVVQYASAPKNSEVFSGLVELFARRAAIPDHDEFPRLHPRLESYLFPAEVLPASHLETMLSPQRIADLRAQMESAEESKEGRRAIRYVCPWNDQDVIDRESVDFVYSQAVLEHVNDIASTYRALHVWLRTGGFMSHVIDFASHGLVPDWNGHWSFDDFEWRIVKGARPFLLNRLVLGDHLKEIEKCGFHIVKVTRFTDDSGLPRERLAARYRDLTAEDLRTCSAHVIAQKI